MEPSPKKIGDLFGKYQKSPTPSKKTERGELLRYFAERLNVGRDKKNLKPITVAGLAYILQKVPVFDLYYLKSDCLDAENSGIPFGAAFWTRVKGNKLSTPQHGDNGKDMV